MSKETEIKKNVFEKIRTGEISMRPKIYFIVRVILLVIVSLLILALALFVLSFSFFSIHESGEQFLLGFGWRGLRVFVALFPWWSFFFTIVLILLLDHLLRYFKFGYRVSMLGIFLVVLIVVTIAGLAINFTPFHSSLLDSADRNELPIIGSLYEEIQDAHHEQGVYRGTITAIQGNEFSISHDDNDRDTDDGTWTIVAPTEFDTTTLRLGERVYVAGILVRGVVNAYGIKEFVKDNK